VDNQFRNCPSQLVGADLGPVDAVGADPIQALILMMQRVRKVIELVRPGSPAALSDFAMHLPAFVPSHYGVEVFQELEAQIQNRIELEDQKLARDA